MVPNHSRQAGRPGELDERVHAGNPFAPLKLADRCAMKGGAHRQLFLGEVGTLAAVGQVLPELDLEIVGSRGAFKTRLQAIPRSGSRRALAAPMQDQPIQGRPDSGGCSPRSLKTSVIRAWS